MKNSEKRFPSNSDALGVQSIQPVDHFMKLVFGSSCSAEQIAHDLGAEKGSYLEKLLIQLCDGFRRDED